MIEVAFGLLLISVLFDKLHLALEDCLVPNLDGFSTSPFRNCPYWVLQREGRSNQGAALCASQSYLLRGRGTLTFRTMVRTPGGEPKKFGAWDTICKDRGVTTSMISQIHGACGGCRVCMVASPATLRVWTLWQAPLEGKLVDSTSTTTNIESRARQVTTALGWILIGSLRADFTAAIDTWWEWLLDSLFILNKDFYFLKQIESAHVSPEQLWLLLELIEWWTGVARGCTRYIPGWEGLIRTHILNISRLLVVVLLFKLFGRHHCLLDPRHYFHSVFYLGGITLFCTQLRGTDLSLIEFDAWSLDFNLWMRYRPCIWVILDILGRYRVVNSVSIYDF